MILKRNFVREVLANFTTTCLVLAAPSLVLAQGTNQATPEHPAAASVTDGNKAMPSGGADAPAVGSEATAHGTLGAAAGEANHAMAAGHEAGAPVEGAPSATAGEEHAAGTHHSQGIPMSVWLQVVNFLLFVALLVYFLRKPMKAFFSSREEIYKQALVKGENARREAEAKRFAVEKRLNELEATSGQALEHARIEAAALVNQIHKEAQELSERLRTDAARTGAFEVARAKNLIREEMLAQSIVLSRKMLHDKMAEGDQKRLQTEFVDKIQEVR